VHLIDRAGLPRDARDELRREAGALWHAAGVAIAWLDAAPTAAPAAGDSALYVIVAGDDGPETASPRVHGPLASIRFVAGAPATHVVADAAVARSLLASARLDGQPFGERPRRQRDRVLGRVLGRAVAHEIGHYVFASPAHAPVGLMRAAHRLEHLMTAAHPWFRVVAPAIPTCLMTQAAPASGAAGGRATQAGPPLF
jgi:hypothetical protein